MQKAKKQHKSVNHSFPVHALKLDFKCNNIRNNNGNKANNRSETTARSHYPSGRTIVRKLTYKSEIKIAYATIFNSDYKLIYVRILIQM